MNNQITTTEPTFKVGEFYRYTPKTTCCCEGIAEMTERGLMDAFWGSSGSESSPLSVEEKATAVLIFDSSEYDELDCHGEHRWEKFNPSDRQKTTEQHGLRKRWFVRKGAVPDLDTQIANAQARVKEAEEAVRSANGMLEWRQRELQKLQEQQGAK